MLEAYEVAADAFTSTAAERMSEPESFWIKRITDPSGLSAVFGAFIDEVLVGTVALELSAKPKTKHKGHVIGMYTTPNARGKGVGNAVLQALLTHSHAKKELKSLTLTVTENNAPAINLYSRFGFASFGTEPMAIFTHNGFKSKVHMWLAL